MVNASVLTRKRSGGNFEKKGNSAFNYIEKEASK